MGGGHDGESVPRCRCPDDVTLVLVGKVGSGKSATGNSILGRNAFESEHSCTSVTQTSQMHSRTFRYGSSETRTINVIDTPGLFDVNTEVENAAKEIAKCMELTKDGIHAMLLVCSASTRFSREDVDTVESIKMFFGDSIAHHMILVFTNGDQVDDNTLKKMLSNKRAIYMQEVHERQKAIDGYTAEEMFKSKKDIYDEYFMLITKMVEDKLNSTIEKMQNQLMKEQKARRKVEQDVAEVKMRAAKEIREQDRLWKTIKQDRVWRKR